MAEEPIYISVSDPISLRKNILHCSRDVITSLKNYESYKGISREVIETSYQLRKVIEELVVLNRKLRQALPKSKLSMRHPEKGEKKSRFSISKLEDLEKSLDQIERKLKGMK